MEGTLLTMQIPLSVNLYNTLEMNPAFSLPLLLSLLPYCVHLAPFLPSMPVVCIHFLLSFCIWFVCVLFVCCILRLVLGDRAVFVLCLWVGDWVHRSGMPASILSCVERWRGSTCLLWRSQLAVSLLPCDRLVDSFPLIGRMQIPFCAFFFLGRERG